MVKYGFRRRNLVTKIKPITVPQPNKIYTNYWIETVISVLWNNTNKQKCLYYFLIYYVCFILVYYDWSKFLLSVAMNELYVDLPFYTGLLSVAVNELCVDVPFYTGLLFLWNQFFCVWTHCYYWVYRICSTIFISECHTSNW